MEDRIPGSNDLALNKVGSGTLTLSGSSTYSGSTFVSQGTLAAGSTTGLGSNSDFTVSANAFLDLAGNSSTIASLSGAGSVIDSGASATLTTNGTNNATTEYDGTISGPIDLIKDGTGILTLTGDNTYTGGTTVGGGTLLADSSNSTGSGPVDVESGGTIGGYGTVDGKITVESGGSTYPGSPQIVASSSIASEDVSPFVSSSGNTPQILTASSIEYKDGSTAQFAIATSSGSSHPPTPGTDYDQIVLTGNVPCDLKIDSGTTTLQLNFTSSSLAAVQANAQNHLLDNYFLFRLGCSGGTSDGEFSDLTLTEGANTYTEAITNGDATFSSLGLQFDVSYDADSSTDSLTGGEDVGLGVFAVPEPGDWAPLIALLVALAVLQRRCSKQRTA
jgi:autotransporter-associated beta strand protein